MGAIIKYIDDISIISTITKGVDGIENLKLNNKIKQYKNELKTSVNSFSNFLNNISSGGAVGDINLMGVFDNFLNDYVKNFGDGSNIHYSDFTNIKSYLIGKINKLDLNGIPQKRFEKILINKRIELSALYNVFGEMDNLYRDINRFTNFDAQFKPIEGFPKEINDYFFISKMDSYMEADQLSEFLTTMKKLNDRHSKSITVMGEVDEKILKFWSGIKEKYNLTGDVINRKKVSDKFNRKVKEIVDNFERVEGKEKLDIILKDDSLYWSEKIQKLLNPKK